jgi:O-antigen/teichoic acid export membrane protein
MLTLVVMGPAMLDWFGPEFTPAYVALLLLAAAETIQGAFSISDLLLLYLRARLALVVTVAMIVVHLATAVPLIAAYGIDGAAWSVLLAIVTGALLRRWLLRSRFDVTTPLLHGAGPLLAAAVATIAAIALQRFTAIDSPHSHLFGALAAVLAVYGGGLLVWQRVTGQSLKFTGFRAA